MAEINEIRVCIGNYGYYNEGELRDKWITLPKTDEEIERFLKENGLQDPFHEEIYISDYDGIPLGMPYGDVFSEYTSLEDLNLLAKQMQDAPDWKLVRAAAAIKAGYVEPSGIEEVMNLIEQADDIALISWPDKFDYASDEERLAYAVIGERGGLDNLNRSVLERHFNRRKYGKLLDDEGFVVGERGYLDPGIDEIRDGLYDAGDIIEEAKLLGWDGSLEGVPNEALKRSIAEIESLGYKINEDADPVLVFAIGNLIENLDDVERDALELYSGQTAPVLDAAELGNIVLQVDDINYRQYTSKDPDKHVRLANTCIDEEGGIGNLLVGDLADCFDYRSYGKDISWDYLICDAGYIISDPYGIDLDRFDRNELKEMIEGSWMPEGAKPRPASTAGIVGHAPIIQTGSLSPSEYSYPPEPGAFGRFAFADEASSKAAMEADFDALASQIEDYAVDPDNSPLAFGTPDEQLHAMRVLAAWHGEGEPTRDLASYCNAVEPMLKQSLAAHGIEWDRARGAKTPDAAIAAAKEAASKSASTQEAARNLSR